MNKRYETNPKALLTAKEILYRDNDIPNNEKWIPVKVAKGWYGGARVDRIRERNRVTNALGLTECHGLEFMSLNESNGSGAFLANVLADAAKGIDTLRVDGIQLWPQTGFEHHGSYMGYKEAPLPQEVEP